MHGSLRETAKLLETHSMVYGSGEVVKQWCRENDCIYVDPSIVIKNKLKAIKRMKRNAASFDNDSNLSNG